MAGRTGMLPKPIKAGLTSMHRANVIAHSLFVLHSHNVRSHLLNPGIASFSVITGSNTMISMNQTQSATIHRNVGPMIEIFGGLGKGLDLKGVLVAPLACDLGTGGSGLDSASRSDVGADSP